MYTEPERYVQTSEPVKLSEKITFTATKWWISRLLLIVNYKMEIIEMLWE